jgi:hypothetical protein
MGVLATFGRWHLTMTCVIVLVAIVMAIAAPVWTASGQPGSYTHDITSSGSSCSPGSSPCNSFYGANSCPPLVIPGDTTYSCSWGAGTGWYIDIVGAGIVTVGFILLLSIRRDAYAVQVGHSTTEKQRAPGDRGEDKPVPPHPPRLSPSPPGK